VKAGALVNSHVSLPGVNERLETRSVFLPEKSILVHSPQTMQTRSFQPKRQPEVIHPHIKALPSIAPLEVTVVSSGAPNVGLESEAHMVPIRNYLLPEDKYNVGQLALHLEWRLPCNSTEDVHISGAAEGCVGRRHRHHKQKKQGHHDEATQLHLTVRDRVGMLELS